MNHLQFVALTYNDGSVGVMQILRKPRVAAGVELPGLDPETGERAMTDEVIQYEVDRSVMLNKTVISWRRIEPEQLPTDRTFRAAWRDSGEHIYHDMPTCREVHRDNIRRRRAPMLAQLDIEAARVLETWPAGSSRHGQVIAKKNKLRNATDDPRIEAAASPEELKAIDPLSD